MTDRKTIAEPLARRLCNFAAGMLLAAQTRDLKEFPMRGKIATILGTVICVAALSAWFFTAPAIGSGWILFVAFLGTLGFLDSIQRQAGLATVAGVLITGASGAAWWFHRELPNSGWVLFLCILCALGTFHTLSNLVSAETKTKKN
ncbi:MAG: hypothetical protein K2W95_05810 [Candidatus Obscuribacterales bacterium]|nr:hypothetical protein [Candidatus Obscuribacterales bacterium]